MMKTNQRVQLKPVKRPAEMFYSGRCFSIVAVLFYQVYTKQIVIQTEDIVTSHIALVCETTWDSSPPSGGSGGSTSKQQRRA